MELRQVRYFVAVAEELHFGRAAKRMHVAQPALSKQVMNLERELGARLLERWGRKVELTEAGRVFLERARVILEGVAEAREAAAQAGRGEVGRLSVGFTGMALYGVAPQIVKAFGGRYPGVDLVLQEMGTPAMVEALLGRRADVGFLHPPVSEAGEALAVEGRMSEPLIVALPEDHALSGLSEVSLGRLAEERFVIVPRDEGPELHDRVMGTCHASGLSSAVANRNAPSQTTALSLVAAGVGVSLVWECMRNLGRPGVVYRPLAEPTPRLETALAWRRDDSSPVLAAFLALAREVAGKTEGLEFELETRRSRDTVLPNW
jgi:DNA-binding transcriptional LysR family regulator